MDFLIGDKLSVPGRAGTRHVGVYSAPDTVIHNSKVHLRVVEEPLWAFAAGGMITIEARATPGTEWLVVARARQHLGTSYNLITWNCEHLVEYARTGVPASGQLTGAFGLLALFAGVVAVAFDQRGYDSNVDRHRDSSGRFRSTIL